MKRVRGLVLGGIQNKILNLILLTVILLSAVNFAVYVYHSNMLSDLAAQSSQKQQEVIGEVTSEVMDGVVTQSLGRSNKAAAKIADEMFEEAGNRIAFYADYASGLVANPEDYELKPYSDPDPADDGTWTMKVIYAEGTRKSDPALKKRIGLFANMSGMMISMCRSTGAANVYIAIPF